MRRKKQQQLKQQKQRGERKSTSKKFNGKLITRIMRVSYSKVLFSIHTHMNMT